MAELAIPIEVKQPDYICETCNQANQFTPQLAIQCRFCGGHILSKPRTSNPKPIKMFGCDHRISLEEEKELEELEALSNMTTDQRIATSLIRLQKFKESFVEDLLQQLITVSPKAKKKTEASLRKFLTNLFSSWFLTANVKGMLNVSLFPKESIVIQADLVNKLKEPELPNIVSAVHVNFPSVEDLGVKFDLPLLDFKATRTVDVQGKKVKVSEAQADRLVKMYKGPTDELDLHVYHLYNLYSIIGNKLCAVPAAAAASGFPLKPAMDLFSTPLTAQSARFNSHFFFEQEIWGSESEPFQFKIRGGESAPVYLLFTLDRNLSNLGTNYIMAQFARNIKNVDIMVLFPKKEETSFEAVDFLKKSKFFRKSKSIDSETHRLVDPDQKFCKPNKDDLILIHLANYESELKLGDYAKEWKKASQ